MKLISHTKQLLRKSFNAKWLQSWERYKNKIKDHWKSNDLGFESLFIFVGASLIQKDDT